MSATDFFEIDILELLFINLAVPNVGNVAGLQPAGAPGSFFISLHTGNVVSDTSTLQTDSEAAYTGYGTRPGVARSAAGWTVATGTCDNDAAITFPASTSSETETDFGIGDVATGAGNLQIYGSLTADLSVTNGVTPEFAPQALAISLD